MDGEALDKPTFTVTSPAAALPDDLAATEAEADAANAAEAEPATDGLAELLDGAAGLEAAEGAACAADGEAPGAAPPPQAPRNIEPIANSANFREAAKSMKSPHTIAD